MDEIYLSDIVCQNLLDTEIYFPAVLVVKLEGSVKNLVDVL